MEHKLADEKELKQIEKDIRQQIEADVEKIKQDPMPDDTDMYAHVYREPQLIRGVEYG